MSGFTREQLRADPLWRASHGLPLLKPQPAPTFSEPRQVTVRLPGWELPLIGGPDPIPPELTPPPPDPFAIDPTSVTSEQLDAMFKALQK